MKLCVKILRYYDTKAVRRNIRNSNVAQHSYVQDDKKPRFTHVKKAAFTLAEVLITLGIIGIVAAMTIPTLVSKIQEAHFHAKWKECYAILNNAFKMTVADNFGMIVSPGVSDSSEKGFKKEFIDAMLSHLSVIDTFGNCSNNISNPYSDKFCNRNNNTDWSALSGIVDSGYKSLTGVKLNSYAFCQKAALLKNGASVYFGGSASGLVILVDVNNFRGEPNIVGKDVYAINLQDNGYTGRYRVEELYFKPFGAEGTNTATAGYQGCDENIGRAEVSTTLYVVPGAGCSYKYLYEK